MRRAWAWLGALLAGAAMAADPPTPKVMNDAPANEGKWKMEILPMPGSDKADASGMSGMMVCTTAGKAMAARDEDKSKKSSCRFKMVEDSSSRAVMEMTCPDDGTATRTTITKVAARSYEMTAQDLKKPDEKPMRARMTYVGPCSANESVMSYDKDSKACQQMRTQLPQIEKGRASCASAGANRAMCEQAIDQQVSQIRSMCGP